ncbi:hypothetical protein TWF281_004175 [Arthrobotrys megalospora]
MLSVNRASPVSGTPWPSSWSSASALIIPTILTEAQSVQPSPSEKINTKSPLSTKSKSRTGVPITIDTRCDSKLGVRPRSECISAGGLTCTTIETSSPNPSFEESDRSYFQVGAELDDEDYLHDEYRHAGHKSALSFSDTTYSMDSATVHSAGSTVSSQPSPAEQCLMRKEFCVEVREYEEEDEKTKDLEEDDGGSLHCDCCGLFRWLEGRWGYGA